jgi:hypothetical protein
MAAPDGLTNLERRSIHAALTVTDDYGVARAEVVREVVAAVERILADRRAHYEAHPMSVPA